MKKFYIITLLWIIGVTNTHAAIGMVWYENGSTRHNYWKLTPTIVSQVSTPSIDGNGSSYNTITDVVINGFSPSLNSLPADSRNVVLTCDPPWGSEPPMFAYPFNFPVTVPQGTDIGDHGCAIWHDPVDYTQNGYYTYSAPSFYAISPIYFDDPFNPAGAVATKMAKIDNDVIHPNDVVHLEYAVTSQISGSDFGGWLSGGILGDPWHLFGCSFLTTCTPPPYVDIQANLPNGSLFSGGAGSSMYWDNSYFPTDAWLVGGQGGSNASLFFNAPALPGTYSIIFDKTKAPISLMFTVVGNSPSINIHFSLNNIIQSFLKMLNQMNMFSHIS